MHPTAPAATPFTAPDRATVFSTVREELREQHRRLTERQIDLIADVAVELELAKVRLGIAPLATTG